ATDDHQTANARAIAESGAAWIMPQEAFTVNTLAAKIQSLLETPSDLEKAAACARDAGQPDAAARLADIVAELAPYTVTDHNHREAA
ncbi:MAG: glycosyltransferase, partial [Alphaproteobacteria bacterium]